MLVSTYNAKAQLFLAGDTHVNVGIGVGGYLSFVSYGDFRSSPLLSLSVDYGYLDDIGPGTIGLGGIIGYKTASYDYNYSGFQDQGKWTDLVIGGRGTYHVYLDIDKVDIYGVVGAGIIIENYNYTSNYPLSNDDNFSSTDLRVYFGMSGGAKYMFTENLGAYAEVGYDVSWIKIGVTLAL